MVHGFQKEEEMTGKRFYWLKLKVGYFDQPQIRKLRKVPGGDTYTIIYLKLQLLSLENDCKIMFQGIDTDFESELALLIDEDLEAVKVTLAYFQRQGMIEIKNPDEIDFIEAHSLVGGESVSAERVRNFRERQKALLCNNDVTESLLQCNKNVTLENRDKSIDNIERNINTKKESGNVTLKAEKNEEVKPEDIIYSLILNDKTRFDISKDYFFKLQDLYQNADIMQELRKMDGWLSSNPRKRKTRTGIKSFITNWLSRAQNSPSQRSTEKTEIASRFESSQEEWDAYKEGKK